MKSELRALVIHNVGGLGSDVCGWANSAATERKTLCRDYVAALPPTKKCMC